LCSKSEIAPNEEWVFILDQLNTHQSESTMRWIAHEIGYGGDLGEKGQSGILKSLSGRAEFLSKPEHRIRFVYTPKQGTDLMEANILAMNDARCQRKGPILKLEAHRGLCSHLDLIHEILFRFLHQLSEKEFERNRGFRPQGY
jgi:hypothetical protein